MSKSAAAKFEVVNVLEPLERAVGGVEHEFHARGASLRVEKPAGAELAIIGDESTLEQLFSNVLLNAAQAVRASLPVTERVAELYAGAKGKGLADQDYAAVAAYLASMAPSFEPIPPEG